MIRKRIQYWVVVCWLMTFGSLAGENVLILNTNVSIDKYRTAQKAFNLDIGSPASVIDLGKPWIDEAEVSRSIDKHDPEILYCIGSKAYLMALRLKKRHNIVLSSVINWKRFKIGERTHGVANEIPAGIQLTMFHYVFPDIRKIGVLYSKKYNEEWLELAVSGGNAVGIEVVGYAGKRPRDSDRNIESMITEVDAVWLTPDPNVMSSRDQILNLFKRCDDANIPIFAYDAVYENVGATMIISADEPTIGRQAAGLVRDILRKKQIDNKIQNPAGSVITLNLKKIDQYKLKWDKMSQGIVNKIIR